MNTKELINGIIDLTNENEKLKIELEKVKSEKESNKIDLDESERKLFEKLKTILCFEIWDKSDLLSKIATYDHRGYSSDRDEKYVYIERTKEEFLDIINYKDLEEYNQVTKDILNFMSFGTIKNMFLTQLSKFYDKNEKQQKQYYKEYCDKCNKEIKEKWAKKDAEKEDERKDA